MFFVMLFGNGFLRVAGPVSSGCFMSRVTDANVPKLMLGLLVQEAQSIM